MSDLDPNDPINILLKPFDPLTNVTQRNAAEASRAAAAAAVAAAVEKQRLVEEAKHKSAAESYIVKQQQAADINVSVFGGAEGQVLYESNVRPSKRQWEPSNRVEIRRSVDDFLMSDPLPPEQVVPDGAATHLQPPQDHLQHQPHNAPQYHQTQYLRPSASPVSFSTAIQVQAAPLVGSSPLPTRRQAGASPQPQLLGVSPQSHLRPPNASPSLKRQAGASPQPNQLGTSPRQTGASPNLPRRPPIEEPAGFSPTAGIQLSTNKTEQLLNQVQGGKSKVRQCPSFRMLEFQLEYEEYKESKNDALAVGGE